MTDRRPGLLLVSGHVRNSSQRPVHIAIEGPCASTSVMSKHHAAHRLPRDCTAHRWTLGVEGRLSLYRTVYAECWCDVCSQFEVKDVAWDANLGAEKLDLILLNHFADEFQEKHGIDIRAFPKAVAKLKRQVHLSRATPPPANTFSPVHPMHLHATRDRICSQD